MSKAFLRKARPCPTRASTINLTQLYPVVKNSFTTNMTRFWMYFRHLAHKLDQTAALGMISTRPAVLHHPLTIDVITAEHVKSLLLPSRCRSTSVMSRAVQILHTKVPLTVPCTTQRQSKIHQRYGGKKPATRSTLKNNQWTAMDLRRNVIISSLFHQQTWQNLSFH